MERRLFAILDTIDEPATGIFAVWPSGGGRLAGAIDVTARVEQAPVTWKRHLRLSIRGVLVAVFVIDGDSSTVGAV